MSNKPSATLWRVLTVAVGLLIVKVTVEVMLGYANYFPPNFDSDFLRGREGYFFGAYRWAFYPHIASGPAALFLGLVLLSESFRLRFPKWHRNLGRIHTANVLCVVTPSGLWMAYHTSTGTVAAVSFAILSVLTGTCIALGWRAAVKRKFAVHRRWMSLSFLLLCSAVVLRLFGGFGTVMGVQSVWFDPVASWASWLLPLAALELSRLSFGRKSRALTQSVIPQPTT
jgi:uncharacterized membrane protein YozB (DUF420 family)